MVGPNVLNGIHDYISRNPKERNQEYFFIKCRTKKTFKSRDLKRLLIALLSPVIMPRNAAVGKETNTEETNQMLKKLSSGGDTRVLFRHRFTQLLD